MYSFLDNIIHPGSLVFDVGANRGTMTSVYLAHGASVIAVEPSAGFADKLASNCPAATIVRKAVARTGGETLTLHLSGTLSTIVPKLWWVGRFRHIGSIGTAEVETVTLDQLISTYGKPDYIKIDCEGYDLEVVLGLSILVPALSFEYIEEQTDRAIAAMHHLVSIGFSEFNLMIGGMRPLTPDYNTEGELIHRLNNTTKGMWGDIVALSGDTK